MPHGARPERAVPWRVGPRPEEEATAIYVPLVAAKLLLSEETVRNDLSSAISKLGSTNRVDAARVARAKGGLWVADRGATRSRRR